MDYLIMTSNKLCIIGSGAASYFAYKHLIEIIGVKSSDIDIITTGSVESANALYSPSLPNHSLTAKKMVGVIPDKLLFGSDTIYRRDRFIRLDTKGLSYIPKSTQFFGGLTHVWGANLSLLSEADLKVSSDLLALTKYDAGLFAEFNASGRVVNGRSSDQAILVDREKYINDDRIHKIITDFKHESRYGKFKIAYSNLAINVSTQENGCIYCGQCLTGCLRKSIWSAAEAFQSLAIKTQLNILSFAKVESVSDNGDEVTVKYKKDCIQQERQYRKVFLAAGVLDTVDILANSGLLPNKAKIHDSAKYYTLFFTFKKSELEYESKDISLSSLTYQYATQYGTIHSQIYPSSKILSDIISKFPLPIFVKRFLVAHFKIGMVYLPEGLSDSVFIEKNEDKYMVSNSKSTSKKVSKRIFYLLAHYAYTAIHFLPLLYLKLPIYYRVPVLNSQHFGNVRDFDGVHINDLIPKNIRTIDSSAIRYVTGIPTTLIVAANAKYEIDKVFKNE